VSNVALDLAAKDNVALDLPAKEKKYNVALDLPAKDKKYQDALDLAAKDKKYKESSKSHLGQIVYTGTGIRVGCGGGIGSLTNNGSGVNEPNNPYLVRRGLESRT